MLSPPIVLCILILNNGDTVFVYDDSSPYYERVTIDTSISFIGENKETTIVDGENNGTVIKINVDGVIVTGFTIKRSTNKPGISYRGIDIYSSNNQIYENIICNHYIYGIAVVNSTNNEIFSNYIYSTNKCIGTSETENIKIYDNTINSGETAIALTKSSNIEISNNTIESAVERGIS
ncbi:unnamed protein product, partial [marine sediment metagenome]